MVNAELEVAEANAAVVAEVGSWEGITVERHSRGGERFRYGRREIGHLHDGWPVAHIPLPKQLRDELVASGRAQPHPVMPDSGWLGSPIRTEAEIAGTIELFRRAYERAQEIATQ